MDGWMEFLPILQDFIPCWGRCPKRNAPTHKCWEIDYLAIFAIWKRRNPKIQILESPATFEFRGHLAQQTC